MHLTATPRHSVQKESLMNEQAKLKYDTMFGTWTSDSQVQDEFLLAEVSIANSPIKFPAEM